MRIEIDTEKHSKTEIGHLARMLLALSGSTDSTMISPRKIRKKDLARSEPSSSGGLFSLFNDEPKKDAPTQDYNPSSTSGMMGMFDLPSQHPTQSVSSPEKSSETFTSIFDEPTPAKKEEKEPEETVQIVPY